MRTPSQRDAALQIAYLVLIRWGQSEVQLCKLPALFCSGVRDASLQLEYLVLFRQRLVSQTVCYSGK